MAPIVRGTALSSGSGSSQCQRPGLNPGQDWQERSMVLGAWPSQNTKSAGRDRRPGYSEPKHFPHNLLGDPASSGLPPPSASVQPGNAANPPQTPDELHSLLFGCLLIDPQAAGRCDERSWPACVDRSPLHRERQKQSPANRSEQAPDVIHPTAA
jgi:hypothetical protein